jgi:pilus assembly protein Flp/PilA
VIQSLIVSMRNYVDRHRPTEDGATAVEYGIMVALIAVVIIFAVTTLGENLEATFDSVASAIE